MTVATLAYSTNSRVARVLDPIARVAAAGRVRADRLAREAREEAARLAEWDRFLATGQDYASGPWDVDYCHVCGRVTDHTGEHTPEQIAAWRAGSLWA